ncbi:hypothetical protein BKA64DRAFT_710856 [Cadophora sp. MPI-SDFR-AT-0126]|nr:hypothetical protein BKA64DRAFT_710856 [Leotiomycetes sp. MPI-SDFR-AT-0126]
MTHIKMGPNGSGSRPPTPRALERPRMESSTPAPIEQGRSITQASDARIAAHHSGFGLHDARNVPSYSTPDQPAARMYNDRQGTFTPSRYDENDNGYSLDSSYVQSEERGNGSNIFGGQIYTYGTPQHRSASNGHDFGDNNHGYYESPAVGTPDRGQPSVSPNGVDHTANGGRVEHYLNGNIHSRSFSGADTEYPAPSLEPVIQRPNVYPQFKDGDVRIVSPSGKVWKLHSIILMKASPVFAHLLDTTPGYHVSRRMRAESNCVRWNIIMTADHRARGIDPEGLKYMKFDKINSKDKSLTIMSNVNGLGETAGFNKLYDNFFRCVYNVEPTFANDNDAQARAMIMDATTLLQAAVWLDAVPCVRLIIEANFLRLNQALWKHIGDRPEGWIHIATRLQSPLMFRECLIHIVGKYHLDNGIDRAFLTKRAHGPLTPKIWLLIVQKAKELKDKKLRVERSLMEFYPVRMIHKEDTETIPGRAIYAADIYLWQSLVIFRQFITSAFFSNFHHKAKDGGLAFYRTLGAGDATYLRADTLDKFHQSFDMSPKAKGLLLAALEQIKAEAKNVVAELLVDRSQLVRSPNDRPREHLTCTEVLDEEMPWVAPEEALIDDDLEMDVGYRY